MLKHLLPLIQPFPGEALYVEPFGGSGVVLINKPAHPSETYNDTDGDLVNLFRTIRDPDGVIHLWWELINTQVSRQEFGDALEAGRKKDFSPVSPVQRAAQFVIRCRQRFGGGNTGEVPTDTNRSWATNRSSARGVNDAVGRWLSAMLTLPLVHRRFATVVVDQQDAVRCVNQWDSPQTLFYVDPPYVGTEHYYAGGFGKADHGRLAEALNRLRGRAVVSYYPCAEVERLYPKTGWHRITVQTLATFCGNAPAADRRRRTELILCNFDPKSRRRLSGG